MLLAYLCLHGSKHAWERIEWICDIDRLVRSQTDLDWDKTLKIAKEMDTHITLYLGLALSHALFHTPLPENIISSTQTERIKGLVEKNSFKRYNKFGRILHHIQDMSTPSHVLPIYHGPKFPLYVSLKKIEDHFETFMYKNDDNITLEDVHIPSSDNNINSFFQIYDNAAHEMLEMLKNGFYIDSKHSQKLPYSLFTFIRNIVSISGR